MGLDGKSPSIQTKFSILLRSKKWQYVEYVDNCADINRRKVSADELLEVINEKYKLIKLSNGVLFFYVILMSFSIITGTPSELNLFITITFVFGYVYFLKEDNRKKTVNITYELDYETTSLFDQVNKAFQVINKCSTVWYIAGRKPTHEWKYNGRASESISRKSLSLKQELPPFLNSNIIPYSIKLKDQKYYFFPDKILSYSRNKISSINYFELKLKQCNSPLIENGSVPPDSTILGYTWLHVNRDGNPDKRFKDNHQIPTVNYNEISIQTSSGVDIELQCSRENIGIEFIRYLSPRLRSKI